MLNALYISKQNTIKSVNKTFRQIEKNEKAFLFIHSPTPHELQIITELLKERKAPHQTAYLREHPQISSYWPLQFTFQDICIHTETVTKTTCAIHLFSDILIILIKDHHQYQEYIKVLSEEIKNDKKKARLDFILFHFLEFGALDNYDVLDFVNNNIAKLEETIINERPCPIREMLHVKSELSLISKILTKYIRLIFFLKSGRINLKLSATDNIMLEHIYYSLQNQIEMVSNEREMLTDLLNANSANATNNMNRIMKTLTAITVIIAVPALVTSFFDINFAWAPILDNKYGFYLMLTLISALIYGLVRYFYRKNWL